MDRSDWIGLSTSLGVHAALLVLFALMTGLRPEPQPLGFVEVEFGEFAEGRPVQATPEPQEEPASEATEPQTEPEEPQEEPQAEAQTEPVDLPDEEVEDPETVSPQDEETIPPEPQPEEEQAPQQEENTSTAEAGAESGDDGEGSTEERSAPYNIEGLDRDPVYAPLPQYAEKVDATIRVRVTVDPRGEIVQRIPLMKGNPALERAVMEALQRWRFNALPANAPQENQSGVITFRFRLE
mgnify:CR=1 FL=1